MYLSGSNKQLHSISPTIISLEQDHKNDGTDSQSSAKCILNCDLLETDSSGSFIDSKGRRIMLKGINVDGGMKFPTNPELPSYEENSNDPNSVFFDGDNVSFVGRPFPLDECYEHITRIKAWGYNTIRYLITWEALEHMGPGKYDDDFIEYTIEVIKIINEIGGLYVFIDMHQDVWSRFSGGSGAPMWTLYAAGLQPQRFNVTEAAILHNDSRFNKNVGSEKYPAMIWTTNYMRLSSLVMFTLFFSGKNYFSNLKINGINIQDYLQDHYFNAISYFWNRVNKGSPELFQSGCLLGVESLNEPNCGLMGFENLNILPEKHKARIGTTPTIYECFKLGMGFTCEVDTYKITIVGPQKNSTRVIDPKGQKAWMSKEEAEIIDSRYNWKRDESWEIGKCIFAQAKIWHYNDLTDFSAFPSMTVKQRLDFSHNFCQLLAPTYFKDLTNFVHPNKDRCVKTQSIDKEYFINNNFVDFIIRHRDVVRKITPDCFIFIQPPVLECPPYLKGKDSHYTIDSKTVYTPHYYDGMSLMFKIWNKRYNVDTLGIMREQYFNPILGMVLGEKAIRNCIKKQFLRIKDECEEFLGSIPILMSETGMPFDMDNKKSYESGDYSSQIFALDAISNALEGSQMSHTYWCYTSLNCHKWGDRWNNEDFSFWSSDDMKCNIKYSSSGRKTSFKRSISPLKSDLHEKTDMIGPVSTDIKTNSVDYADGVRASKAVIRPFVVATTGRVLQHEFDFRYSKFNVKIEFNRKERLNAQTVIFLPKLHYPEISKCQFYLSSGKIQYNSELEYLKWYSDDASSMGEESIVIKKLPNPGDKISLREYICPIS